MTYPAPSKGESWSCPGGYSDLTGGVCFKNCSSGNVAAGPICRNDRYGKCKIGLELTDGACYGSCPDRMTGVGPICSSKTPPSYIICGLGYAKNAANCALTIADQTLTAAGLASAVSGDLPAAKAAMAAKVLKKMAKLDPSAAKVFLEAAPDMIKFSTKYASEVSWIATKVAKGAPSPADVRRMHSIVSDMLSDFKAAKRLKSALVYSGLTVVPNVIERVSSNDASIYQGKRI